MTVIETLSAIGLIALWFSFMFPKVREHVDRVRERRVLVDTLTVVILTTAFVAVVAAFLWSTPRP